MRTAWILLIALTVNGRGVSRKIMVIGDSQSEEYRFEVPFSAPESNPIESNTRNWVELLAERRPDDFDFGEYKPNLFEWADVRNAGYEYNWSIPGAFVSTHLDVLTSSILENQEFLTSKIELLSQINEMDAIVLFLGGNDIRSVYRQLYRNTPPPGWPQSLIDETRQLIEIIQEEAPGVPLIVGDFPDVGGTEKNRLAYPDDERRALASEYVLQANTLLKQLLDSKSLPYFEVSTLTTDLLGNGPIRVGNVELFPLGHPENRPRYLFCRDGFHPSTSTQALIANRIMETLAQDTGWSLAPFSDHEILSEILGIDPTVDDDYLNWITGFPVSNQSLLADEDDDGISNLGEFALGRQPILPDAPEIGRDLTFDFEPEQNRTDYVRTNVVGSDNLVEWIPVSTPPPFQAPHPFLRLEFFLLE